jgi:hypothetical protein
MTDDGDDFPRQDELAKWRSDGERLERQRRFAKHALRRQEQQITATSATAADVEARLHAQREFLIEVVGNALGTSAEELRDEVLDKLGALEQQFKAAQDIYNRKLAEVEAVSNALNKLVPELQKEFFAKVDELTRFRAQEQAMHKRHLQQADEHFQQLSKLYAREQAMTNSKIAILERQADQLIATLSSNLQNAALRSDLFDGLAQLRNDLAQLQRKYHS